MELVRQVFAIGLVFLFLGGALWWLRRRGWAQFTGSARSRKIIRRLELAERLALTPQHSLHLVQVSDRALVVGTHPHGLRLVASFPRSEMEGAKCRH